MTNAIKLPSSVEAINAMPGKVSAKYQFYSSRDLITRIESMGYVLSSAQQAFVRNPEKQGYQKHVLRFRLPEFATMDKVEAFNRRLEFPEIVVINSHDGSGAMRLIAGLFRLVCANGLISGAKLDEMRIKHIVKQGVNPNQELEEKLFLVAEKARNLAKVAEHWKGIQVTEDKLTALVRATLEARLKGTEHESNSLLQFHSGILNPLREEDKGSDLWTVFNLLQEKAIKANIHAYNPLEGKSIILRAPKSLDRQVEINKALWNAAEKLAA